MGVMDKFLNYMKLNEDEDDEYEDEYYDEEDEDEMEPASRKSSSRMAPSGRTVEEPQDEPSRKPMRSGASANKVTPIRQSGKKQIMPSGMEVCVIKPTSMEDSQEITQTLLNNRTVVLNLEDKRLGKGVAQRILDYAGGSCYAISGNLQRISEKIFIITPASVDLSGDFEEFFGSQDILGSQEEDSDSLEYSDGLNVYGNLNSTIFKNK